MWWLIVAALIAIWYITQVEGMSSAPNYYLYVNNGIEAGYDIYLQSFQIEHIGAIYHCDYILHVSDPNNRTTGYSVHTDRFTVVEDMRQHTDVSAKQPRGSYQQIIQDGVIYRLNMDNLNLSHGTYSCTMYLGVYDTNGKSIAGYTKSVSW
jgi:hypothetical protein